MRIREVLELYSIEPIVVTAETPVGQAIQLLNNKAQSAVIVVNNLGRLIGIFSDRDFSRQFVLNPKFDLNTPIHKAMSAPVICVDLHMQTKDCLEILRDNNIRHLGVVTESGQPIGVVTALDIVQSLLGEKIRRLNEIEPYDVSEKWPF